MPADTCGAKRGVLVCDRAPHVDGDHRGYDEDRDAVLFWPTDATIIDELERRIRVALAKLEESGRPPAAARLRSVIADAIGTDAAAAIATARAWLDRQIVKDGREPMLDEGDCRQCGTLAGEPHEPTDPCGIVAKLLELL